MVLNLTPTRKGAKKGAPALSASASRLLGLQLDLEAARAVWRAMGERQRDNAAEARELLRETERGLNDFPTATRGHWSAADGAQALRDLVEDEALALSPTLAGSLARALELEAEAAIVQARADEAAATVATLQPLVRTCEQYMAAQAEGNDAP